MPQEHVKILKTQFLFKTELTSYHLGLGFIYCFYFVCKLEYNQGYGKVEAHKQHKARLGEVFLNYRTLFCEPKKRQKKKGGGCLF